MTRWIVALLTLPIAIVGGFLIGRVTTPVGPSTGFESNTKTVIQHTIPPPAPLPADRLPPLLGGAVRQLKDSGWDEPTARAVVIFHREFLTNLFDISRRDYDLAVTRLKQLPGATEHKAVLTEHPEWTGLLLTVGDRDVQDSLVSELKGEDGDLVAGLFLIHHDREGAPRLAKALPGNTRVIADLYRRGLVGGETLFFADELGADEYHRWLREVLRSALTLPNEQLAGLYMLLLEEGEGLRLRFRDDTFRVKFPGLWDKLVRVAGKQQDDLGSYLGLEGLWDFLDDPDAEDLMARWGALPIDLLRGKLDGKPAYPGDCHARVKQLLRTGDPELAALLYLCRGKPSFRPLLKAEFSDDLMRGLHGFLNTRKDRLDYWCEKFQKLSADELREQVGLRSAGAKEFVPFYSVYKVYESYSDGEDPSTVDLLFAATDVASVAIPAGKLVTVSKKAIKEGAKTSVRKEVSGALKAKLGQQAAAAGTVAVNKFTVRQAIKQRLVDSIARIQEIITKGGVSATVDVSKPILYAYERCGARKHLFRRLAGLNPKVTMSRGGRIHLKLSWSKETYEKRQRVIHVLHFLHRMIDPQITNEPARGAGESSPAVRGEPTPGADRTPVSGSPQMATQSVPGGEKLFAGTIWLAAATGVLPDVPEAESEPENLQTPDSPR